MPDHCRRDDLWLTGAVLVVSEGRRVVDHLPVSLEHIHSSPRGSEALLVCLRDYRASVTLEGRLG